ncbi:MAG: YhgE/Pip domain-containing protein [Actinobacteria bacterium]|nr:YhgE/Pip domain-containing protein [Actinomycetota bacterium]
MVSPIRGLRFARHEIENIAASRVMKVLVAVIAVIPLLYGALFLWSILDPYNSLGEIPVAVVNNDEGTKHGKEEINIGDDLVASLEDNDEGLQWNFVSADEAGKGIAAGDYYIMLTIPKDFSRNIASATTDTPTQALVEIEYNQSLNMIASQIGESVFEQVIAALRENVSEQFYENIFVSMDDAAVNIQESADGAGDLSKDLKAMHLGSGIITQGLSSSATGAAALTGGLEELATGTKTLDTGTQALATGMETFATGTEALAAGAEQVSATGQTLASGAEELAAGTEQLATSIHGISALMTPFAIGIQGLADATVGMTEEADAFASDAYTVSTGVDSIDSILNDPAKDDATKIAEIQAIMAGTDGVPLSETALEVTAKARALAASAPVIEGGISAFNTMVNAGDPATGTPSLVETIGALDSAMTGLNTGMHTFASGLALFSEQGLTPLAAGTAATAEGANQLATGTSSLAQGTSALATGTSAIAEGSAVLGAGLEQMAAGSSNLTENIGAAKEGSDDLEIALEDRVEELSISDREKDAKIDVMSDPIAIEESYYTSVDTYGMGLAPYFIALGLWVGALVISLVRKPLNSRIVASNAVPSVAVWAGFLPMAAIAVVQAVLLCLVIQFALKIEPLHIAGYYGFAILIALVFAAIVQMLSAAFGFPGKLVVVILLVLQLSSAAGTFPIETTPAFFRVINPFLPMTYAVAGMREFISGLNMAYAWECVGVLCAFGVVAFLITSFVAHRKRMVTMDDIHPVLQL